MDTTTKSTTSSHGTSDRPQNGRYSFSSGVTSIRSYESDEDAPYSHGGATDYGQTIQSKDEMSLRDVPMEGQRVTPSANRKREAIIEFDHDDGSYHSTPLKSNQEYYDVLEMANSRLARDAKSTELYDVSSSGKRDKKSKKKKKKSKRKKQQLADAMAKFKEALNKTDNDWEFSTNGSKVESPQLSRGLTEKEMKDLSIDDENDFDPSTAVPRSGIWRPSRLVTLAASKSDGGKIDRDGYYKPLNVDKVGGMQKNATARSTAAGIFYEGANLVYEQFQNWFQQSGNDEEMKRDFNLQSLTKRRDTEFIAQSLQSSDEEPRSLQDSIESCRETMPREFIDSSLQSSSRRPKLEHCDSIVWGDESTIGPGVDDEEENGIEMHDYSYSDIHTASQNYRHASELVIEKMKWRRESRLLGCLLSVGGVFLMTCIILYIIGNQSEGSNQASSMPPPILIPNNNTVGRKDPPPRPDAIAPRPVESYNGEVSHPITAQDLDFVIDRITDNQTLLSDPNSPQSKAYAWCKNDLINYKVNNAARLVQRYSLAVLYYSTNAGDGRKWINSTDWLSGHECTWFGIRCEMSEDKIMYVTYIDLSNNLLVGTIPPELGFVTSLTQLQLWGNQISGKIPPSFLQLVDLQTLYLDKNQLTGEIYNTFESMRSLKHLDLSFNKLKGRIPHGLGSLTSLLDLRLSNNHFSGGFPVSIGTLPNLQTLLLDNNAIGGTLSSSIAKMSSLVTLRIHENDFMGDLPDFTHAVLLEEAHLDENYFTGPLPTFGSKRLRSLYLGRNAFTGSIPPSIGELSKLEALYMQANHLVEAIPESISKLTALQQLDLSYNRLTGSIPDSLSGLMQLRELILNDNRLTGNIPDIGSMKRIEIARLSNNLLGGELKFALSVGDLNYMKELSLQNNELRGVVPEFICDLLLNTLTADCWGPSSPVDCPCCSACF
ncbi:hypothetical protein ACHAXN_013384 [Cyclotella atomus]